MKKLIIITLLTALTQFLFSQNTRFGLEIYGGLSNYMDKYNELTDYKFKISYGASLLLDFKLKEKIYLQSGIGYINNGNSSEGKGNYTDGTPVEGTFKISYSQNYITLPINSCFINLGKKEKIGIIAGIYYAYMLSTISRLNYYNEEGLNTWSDKRNITNESMNLNRHDFGLNGEINRHLTTVNNFTFSIGLYGKLGLLATRKNDSDGYGYSNYSFGLKTIVRMKNK
nr:outer membrane beta-barrel protein [uncultured Carboxylicivirga sp.]